MIYLASPYSDPDQSVMVRRFEDACEAVAHLTNSGKTVYSPIVHFHPVAIRHQLPRDFAFWREVNFNMLDRASKLYVLMLDGWRDSVGVQAEIDRAGDNCVFVSMETLRG